AAADCSPTPTSAVYDRRNAPLRLTFPYFLLSTFSFLLSTFPMPFHDTLVRLHLLPHNQHKHIPPTPARHLARLTFIAFLLTFIGSRVIVILIMTRRMPNMFFHAGGTHVHHLNYGIFLLSTVAAVLLFANLNLRFKG